MNVELIFQIAAIGIIVAILHTVVAEAGRKDIGYLIALVGLAIVSLMVIKLLSQLFDAVRTTFWLY